MHLFPIVTLLFFIGLFLPASAYAAEPTVFLERSSPSSEVVFTQEDQATWNITFSENVTGFTEDDIELVQSPDGVWQKSLQGSGSLWSVRIWRSEGGGDGPLQIAIKAGSVTSTGGDPGPYNVGRTSSELWIDQSSPRLGGFSGGGISGVVPGSSWSSAQSILGTHNWIDVAEKSGEALALASGGSMLLFGGSLSFPLPLSGTSWVALEASSASWMALSATGTTRVSADGNAWNFGSALPSSETWVDLLWWNGSFWALSQGGTLMRLTGGLWSEQTTLGSSGWSELEGRGSRLVALSSSGAVRRIFPGSVANAALSTSSSWKHLESSSWGWLAASDDGKVAFSEDGLSWQNIPWSSSVRDIFFWEGRFYILSDTGVAFSADGVDWTSSDMPLGFSGSQIAVGDNSLFALSSSAISFAHGKEAAVSQPAFSLQDFQDNDPSLSMLLQRQVATKSGGECFADWSASVVVSGAASLLADRCYLYTLRATDRAGNSSVWQTVLDTADPPLLSSFERISPVSSRVRSDQLSYRVVFDEPIQPSSFNSEDIVLLGEAASPWSVADISNPSGNGQNWLLGLQATTLQEGELRVGLQELSVEDLSGTLGPDADAWSSSSTWVDLQPPLPPQWSVIPPAVTGSRSPSFSLQPPEEGGRFVCQLDNLPEAVCSSPHTWNNVAEGSHTARFWQEDEAGNRSTALEHSFQVDTTAPALPVISSGPEQGSWTRSTSVSFVWSGEAGADFLCSWGAEPEALCSSPFTRDDLADGSYTFRVRTRDAAGNISAATTRTWNVDTVAPAAPTWTSTPPNPSGSGDAGFYWSGELLASFQCQLGSGAWESCSSPRLLGGLMSGTYVFRVRQSDRAGNVSQPAEWNWEIIRGQPPQPTIIGKPLLHSPTREAVFTFSSASDDRLQCSLDSAAWEVCTSPQTFNSLSDGPHSFRVRHINDVDVVGSAASWTWTVDTVAPTVPEIRTGPQEWSSSSVASFSWSGELGAVSECSLDGSGWQVCSPIYDTGELPEGPHSFRVRSRDAAGNLSPSAERTWNIDRTPPAPPVFVEKPPASSSKLMYKISWTKEAEAQSQCSLNGAPWDICQSPVELRFVSAGRHSFQVRQKDRAGNVSNVASAEWTIDVSQPDGPTIIDFPAKSSRERRVFFSWTAARDLLSECRVDGEWRRCKSPWGYSPPREGKYTFSVRVLNEAGTVSEVVQRSWVTDWTPPRLRSVALLPRGQGKWQLQLQASGARWIEFAVRKGQSGRRLPVAGTVRLRQKPLWARVLDDAGNASPWRKIKS